MRGRKTFSPRALSRASGRAFTLMEMMVGVGAVAIVAVGLAAIFDSVGKTVAGGRRVSVMNTYASLIESQMRRDFENMAREGFMVIRNQWVDVNGNGTLDASDVVPLVDGQIATARKPRRIDEIQFGVVGKFETARQPLLPGVKATSNEALVYFGHGQRAAMRTTLDASNYKYPRPYVGDFNNDVNARLGIASSTGAQNPNEFCGDWTLLRHVTLLVNADAAQTQPVPIAAPGTLVFARDPNGVDYQSFRNRPTQYFLQPAMSSVFRSIGNFYPMTGAGAGTADPDFALRRVAGSDGSIEPYPLRSSGIVDIASSSFADIRAMITTCSNKWPDEADGTAPNEPKPDGQLLPVANTGGTELDRMIAWMNDAMPTDSRNEAAATTRGERVVTGTTGFRLRYEPGPSDLMPAISLDPTSVPAFDRARLRADQLALTASNFVPHCTNFVVEWSFGLMDGNGVVEWYGLPDSAGSPVRPYGANGTSRWYIKHNFDATVPLHEITPRLIYGVNQPNVLASELTAYFGYTDPTFAPPQADIQLPPFDHRTSNAVMDWLWPKMVRVRITLADPNNLSDEREFTYVFNVPDQRAVVRRD